MRTPGKELISTTKVLKFQATNQGTLTEDSLETPRTAVQRQVRLTTNLAMMLIVHHPKVMVPRHNLAAIVTLKLLKTIILRLKR
jgi:ribosomal protein L16/L10AE